jgi:hypothetical protein
MKRTTLGKKASGAGKQANQLHVSGKSTRRTWDQSIAPDYIGHLILSISHWSGVWSPGRACTLDL